MISSNKNFKVNLIVTGSHLEAKFGNSISKEIKKDNINKSKIKIPIKTNKLSEASSYFSEVQNKINKILDKSSTDLIFISSDRFETFAFAISSYLRKIPIIHYEGGDVTEGGALDDNIRHAITKIIKCSYYFKFQILQKNYKNGRRKMEMYKRRLFCHQ